MVLGLEAHQTDIVCFFLCEVLFKFVARNSHCACLSVACNYYHGQKNKIKRTICEICGEKTAVPSCDIMLDHARSALG